MSNVRAFCRTRESMPAGECFVRPDRAGRRSPPIAVCETRADSGCVPSLDLRRRAQQSSFDATSVVRFDSATRRDAVVGEIKNRRDPAFARKDISPVCPWTGDLRCAGSVELRSAFLRAEKRSPPANTSGFEDALWRGGEVLSDGTSFSPTSAQMPKCMWPWSQFIVSVSAAGHT